jgi:hypothetical protein
MLDPLQSYDTTKFISVILGVVMAIAAGATNYLIRVSRGKLTHSRLMLAAELAASAFAGFLAYNLVGWFHLDGTPGASFLIGISGFAGAKMITYFEGLAQRIFDAFAGAVIPPKNKKDEHEDGV